MCTRVRAPIHTGKRGQCDLEDQPLKLDESSQERESRGGSGEEQGWVQVYGA